MPVLPTQANLARSRRFDGSFRVVRGRGLVARFLGWLLRLPAPGDDVHVTLEIITDGDQQKWIRRFGERRLETVTRWLSDGHWRERFLFLEFEFCARAEADVVHHDQLKCRLGMGALWIPWPRLLAPRVEGYEQARADGSISVHIAVRFPVGVLLLEYDGVIIQSGESQCPVYVVNE